jgi:LPS-assembly protein
MASVAALARLRAAAAGLALALAALAAGPAGPQQLPASLVADQVSYDRESGLLVASGNVEVAYQGRVLRATRITYDERRQEIRADGPLQLTDPDGGVLIADAAAMSPDLERGLIESARLLIDGQLQLAAAEARRRDARYSTLYRTVASSCTICAGNPTPTWAIRASRITRDAVGRRIYFEHARVELFGVPVGYLPRMSVPEPGVTRASGFLAPSFLQSQIYGAGFKLPYYRVLGPSADATVTPFLTTSGATLFEGEYRRRFDGGGFDLSGVIAFDAGLEGDPDQIRGSLASDGSYALGQGFVADFDLAVASDDTFLAQFDYSDADRLTSTAAIHRTTADQYLSLGTVAFQSLRDDEPTETIPYVLPQFTYREHLEPALFGGRLAVNAESLGILRDLGSNMVRAGGGVDWRRQWILPQGVLASTTAAAMVAVYQVWDNPDTADGIEGRALPTASAELRRSSIPRSSARPTCRTRTASSSTSTRPTSSRSTASPASTGWRPGCAPTSASATPARTPPAGRSAPPSAR